MLRFVSDARMKKIEFDPPQSGLLTVMKNWELKVMQVVWNSPESANSGTVWVEVNKLLNGGSISRASIINFLNEMKELSVPDADERTGKGGVHLVYKMGMNEEKFKKFIAAILLESLMRDVPEEIVESHKALNSLNFPAHIFSNPNFHKTKVKPCPRFQPARSKVY